MKALLLTVGVLFATPGLLAAQVPEPTPLPVVLAPLPNSLQPPYPTASSVADLARWVKEVERSAHDGMKAARSRQDAGTVSRIIVGLEKARYHAYRELERLSKSVTPPTPTND